jgi:mevalonate kinase
LTTGALAGGGLATVALLNRDKLVQDINKKPVNKEAINKVANYAKDKTTELAELRKRATSVLKGMGIDPNMISDERLRQIMSQFSNTNTAGVKVSSLKDRMSGAYDRNINKIRGRRGL